MKVINAASTGIESIVHFCFSRLFLKKLFHTKHEKNKLEKCIKSMLKQTVFKPNVQIFFFLAGKVPHIGTFFNKFSLSKNIKMFYSILKYKILNCDKVLDYHELLRILKYFY